LNPPSAPSERIPPPRAVERGAEQKNLLFLLEKNWWRAQIRNRKEYFAWQRALASGGGAAISVQKFLLK